MIIRIVAPVTGIRRLMAAVILAVMLLSGCAEEPRQHKAEFFIFGTMMGVTLWGADDAQANEVFSSLQDAFQAMHSDWHAWEPGKLTEINNSFARGDIAPANEDIIELVKRSQELEARTGGRFNAAIGSLINLWGFHTSNYPIIGPPPDRFRIEELLLKQPSSSDIRIDGLTLSSVNPAVQLDFGGIAKGYAIDIACRLIREAGVENAIVNAGGDLRAFGSHGERPWRIAVRAPGGGIVGAMEAVGDEAIFTSGNYERFRQENEKRYPHILDPRTGWPVEDLASVTVITDDGTLADAAATALIVAGLGEWQEVARSLDLDQVMMIDESGKVYQTARMAERVVLEEGVEFEIVDFEAGSFR